MPVVGPLRRREMALCTRTRLRVGRPRVGTPWGRSHAASSRRFPRPWCRSNDRSGGEPVAAETSASRIGGGTRGSGFTRPSESETDRKSSGPASRGRIHRRRTRSRAHERSAGRCQNGTDPVELASTLSFGARKLSISRRFSKVYFHPAHGFASVIAASGSGCGRSRRDRGRRGRGRGGGLRSRWRRDRRRRRPPGANRSRRRGGPRA